MGRHLHLHLHLSALLLPAQMLGDVGSCIVLLLVEVQTMQQNAVLCYAVQAAAEHNLHTSTVLGMVPGVKEGLAQISAAGEEAGLAGGHPLGAAGQAGDVDMDAGDEGGQVGLSCAGASGLWMRQAIPLQGSVSKMVPICMRARTCTLTEHIASTVPVHPRCCYDFRKQPCLQHTTQR